MRLLEEAAAQRTARLADIKHEAVNLLSDLGTLEVRLHRALAAASIDLLVLHLDMERKRILEEEERGELSNSLAGFPVLGTLALISLFRGRKVNWDTLVPTVFREEPFKDIRIAISDGDRIRLVNVSEIARKQDMSIDDAVAYLQRRGNEVLGWPEFEARAKDMRRAVISGELVLGERQKPQALPGRKTKWVRVIDA